MARKKTIKISIPKDVHIAWERDFSFLGCYMIAEQHLKELKRYIDVGYTMCAFYHKNGHVIFYRSESDEKNFDSRIAGRCLEEEGFAKHATEKLKKITDEFNAFFKKQKRLSKDNVKQFFRMANEHFAYHLAVFWSADYIRKNNLDKRNKKIFGMLEKARKYNENILPNIENWIAKQDPIFSVMRPKECVDYLWKEWKLQSSVLSARDEASFVYFDKKNKYVSTGKRAIEYKKKFDKSFLRRFKLSENILKGRPAYKGRYKGKVRVIERFEDFKRVKRGEIIVAPVTRPAYSSYIRRAGAIVADEGAILSHTSIIAREFKIPCVIGTRIATKVLKDGDLVEVNADKGIVKITKKSK
ncbi:MAG: PEP-utilizing enzyme [Candidatus Moranbacteria bacterium]|nr:PEP-utilizing enzyme [Candidatus Moranbacteria bacterium]